MITHLKHWFWPSHTNGYQAYLIRPSVVGVLALTLITINSWAWLIEREQQVLGAISDLSESEIVTLTNIERAKFGADILTVNPQLSQAALKKAEHMVHNGVFEHYYARDGVETNPWQFIVEAGYDYLHAGENLGRDFQTSTGLVEAWMDSPSHRQNLLNPDYQEIGVAIVEGQFLDKQQTTLVVQLLATPMSSLSTSTTISPSPNPENISLSPLIKPNRSWAQAATEEYPMLILAATVGVVGLIVITLGIDIVLSRKRTPRRKLDINLWSS